MSGVLTVLEQRDGVLHKTALEALAAAQQIGGELNVPVFAALPGNGIEAALKTVAGYKLELGVHAIEHELLEQYTPDGYTASALRQLTRATSSRATVIFPHTYQVRDLYRSEAGDGPRPCAGERRDPAQD